MSKVVFHVSMSLDGFMTASGRTPEEPMGAGGLRLFAWSLEDDDPRNRDVAQQSLRDVGAMVTGRTTYDDSRPWWGANGPGGEARTPVFVVTHEAPADPPEDGVYAFVTDGLESAVEQAKAAANGQKISTGGASIGRQLIEAGLVDELHIHLVPVLFGGGISMFDGLADRHLELEPIEVIHTPTVTHLRYELARG